ncbi:MAG: hypothetical protein M1827_005274 [Pycnora praestabilis]|nr:MAG: hypothetical protein M1827_005274 [Pycnora praestabilis]
MTVVVQPRMLKALEDADYPVNELFCEPDYHNRTVTRDAMIMPSYGKEDDANEQTKLMEVGNELKSRVLDFSNPASLAEVLEVLYLINRTFKTPREPDLRIPHQDLSAMDIAFDIDNLIKVDEIIEGFGGKARNGFKAYNLYALRHYRTVEFRQHAGTLDPDRITNWIQFVAGLVRWAHWAWIFGCLPLVSKYAGTDEAFETFSVLDLMREVGLGALVPYYKDKVNDHPAAEVKDMEDERRIETPMRT